MEFEFKLSLEIMKYEYFGHEHEYTNMDLGCLDNVYQLDAPKHNIVFYINHDYRCEDGDYINK